MCSNNENDWDVLTGFQFNRIDFEIDFCFGSLEFFEKKISILMMMNRNDS